MMSTDNTVELRTEIVKKLEQFDALARDIAAAMKVVEESKWAISFEDEVRGKFNEVEMYSKDMARRKILHIFQVVFGRASVSEKQTLCTLHSRGYDYQIVAGKYGIAIQRNKQARQVKEWSELQLLLENKDAVLSALKSSSKQGIAALAEKFEMFASIVDMKKLDALVWTVHAEVPLVRPVKRPMMSINGEANEEYGSIVVWKSYNGVNLGLRSKRYCTQAEEERRSRHGWSDSGTTIVSGGTLGAALCMAMEKDWPYYRLKLTEQLQENVRDGRQMMLLLEEAFAADMLVATL